MKKVYIFIDEFGNAHLDLSKSGTFSHFVYTAIAIKEEDLKNAIQLRNYISHKYFQSKPIQSKHIHNDEEGFLKRLNILKELKKLNFLVFTLVVKKASIKSDGLSQKKTFYKYFQRIFIEQFAKNYNSFDICADKLGYPEFQRSLKDYIQEHAIHRDLFNPDRFYRLADDKEEEPLVQLADFVSGVIGKIFCTSHIHLNADLLFEQISDRLFVDFFPFEKVILFGVENVQNTKEDKIVSEIALSSAVDYIKSNHKSSIEEIEVLKYLLLIFTITPNRIVTSKEIINIVKRISPGFSQALLRQSVQNLRDQSVIIASPQGKYGYKIPNKIDDFVGFYNRYLNSIIPMLKRIKKSNDKLKIKTFNEIDILNKIDNFDVLQKMIEIIENN